MTYNMAAARFTPLARHFSTTAARSGLVSAPIQVFGLEGRYAHALYSAASKQKKLDAVEKDLQTIQALIGNNKNLSAFIANPTIKRQEKRDVVALVLQEQKVSDLSVNLFAAMADNGRLAKMPGVLSAFAKIMSAHRGELFCTVTTAKPLDAANMKSLEAALKGFLGSGQSLQLETKVDPSLIGGMVVNIGDKYVDMSMASKIKAYTNLITEAV